MHHRFKIKKGIDEETKKDNFKIFMNQCNMTMADNESIENNIIYNETQLYLLGQKNIYVYYDFTNCYAFCNYLEYKKFLLSIDKKKYDDMIDYRNKTKLIQKIQEDKLKQTINIDLEYINIGITNDPYGEIKIEIILNEDIKKFLQNANNIIDGYYQDMDDMIEKDLKNVIVIANNNYKQEYHKIIDVKNINGTVITNIGCRSIEYCYSYIVYENLHLCILKTPI